MKKATPKFRTPEPLRFLFLMIVLVPIGMMGRNAYVFLQDKHEVVVEENGELVEEVAQLKEDKVELGETVVGLEEDLVQAKLENERLMVAKAELNEEIKAVRVQIGYHESREDSLQRVIDLLKNEIVANERKIVALREENAVAAQAFRRMSAGEVAGGNVSPEIAEKNYFELVKANEQLAKEAEANDRHALELLTEISELNSELEHFKSVQEKLKAEVATLNHELLEKRALIDAIAVRQGD